jgi:hypothetical protein
MTRRLAIAAALLAAIVATGCKPTPDPLTVDIVGDSITAQSYWGRDAAWLTDGPGAPAGSDILKDAWLGYKFEDVQERETERVMAEENPRPSILVIALGTNNASLGGGGWTTADEAAFSKLLNTPHPNSCVVVSLPAAGPAAGPAVTAEFAKMRAAMRSISATRPRTVVVDWADIVTADPTVLAPDGVHLASDERHPANNHAAAAFASNLWSGVAECPGA